MSTIDWFDMKTSSFLMWFNQSLLSVLRLSFKLIPVELLLILPVFPDEDEEDDEQDWLELLDFETLSPDLFFAWGPSSLREDEELPDSSSGVSFDGDDEDDEEEEEDALFRSNSFMRWLLFLAWISVIILARRQ